MGEQQDPADRHRHWAADRTTLDGLVRDAATAMFYDDRAGLARALSSLSDAATFPGNVVVEALGGALADAVRRSWSTGWQPVDLRRAAARKLTARHARLVVSVVAADAHRYRDHPDTDVRWLSQLDAMGATPASAAHGRPVGDWPVGDWAVGDWAVGDWAARECLAPADAALPAIELLALLWRLPQMPHLMDPPDRWGMPGARTHRIAESLDPKVLARVRALLAKAESTTFTEEAETYTAKAQHLMARHSLDRAAVDGTGGTAPEGRRIGVDDPYAAAKALLLSEVAASGRSRVVWSREFGFSTAFGYPTDLDMLEMLYTSLLVQATTSMVRAGSGSGDRRWRSRAFRQAFLVAYATRVGQRLRETDAASVAEAESVHGAGLLPVLASRLDRVDDARQEAFPDATHTVLSANDRAGWIAGTVAAEVASLAAGPELTTMAG
jgi:hypothetical protein